jgi:hypothetical protein
LIILHGDFGGRHRLGFVAVEGAERRKGGLRKRAVFKPPLLDRVQILNSLPAIADRW